MKEVMLMLTKTSNVHQAGKDLVQSRGNSSACSRRMSQSTADQMETAKRALLEGLSGTWRREECSESYSAAAETSVT